MTELLDRFLAALRTSKFIRESIGDVEGWFEFIRGASSVTVVEEVLSGFLEGSDTRLLYASSFLFFSNRLHRVERILTCSLRSLMVSSFSSILSLHASRSILSDSFSNSLGLVARVGFAFVLV